MPLDDVSTNDPHVSAHNEERDAINALEVEVDSKITAPPNIKVGEFPVWTGQGWGVSDLRLFEGEGHPEGRVAAPIGSRYRDTNGTNGAVEWIKLSGLPTSNTGWLLVSGDTGWRNVLGLLALRSNGQGHVAMLRRVGDVVDLYLDLTNPTNTSSPWETMVLPVGFRPGFTRYGAMQDNKEAAAGSTAVLLDGKVNLYSLTSAKRDRYNGTWTTKDPWPTDLPGVPG